MTETMEKHAAHIGAAFLRVLADPQTRWRETGAKPFIDAVADEAAALAAKPQGDGARVTEDAGVDAFLAEVRTELIRARAKFPGDRLMTIALAEEFGELCKAVLDEPSANVRKEAVQTAVMAARVALDGDSSVNEWRRERGLDALARVQGGAK